MLLVMVRYAEVVLCVAAVRTEIFWPLAVLHLVAYPSHAVDYAAALRKLIL